MAECAWLALGGNLGDSRATIAEAARRLDRTAGIEIGLRSHLYRTPAWGVQDQPDFLNAALAVDTTLEPHALLDAALAIETDLGRMRGRRWGERTIDIDLVHYSGVTIRDERLVLPHPLWRERAFVLVPLAEIAPTLVIDGIAVAEAARRIDAHGIVRLADPW